MTPEPAGRLTGKYVLYEPCVRGADGRCTRWSHSHDDRPATMAPTPDTDHALDWLIRFAEACDISVTGHYMHIADGQHETCGCRWEGNDDPR